MSDEDEGATVALSSALQMKRLLICIQYTESIHFSIHYEHRNHPLSFTDWGKTKCEVQCGVSSDTAFKDAWRKSAAQIELWWNNWMFPLQQKCSARSLQYIFYTKCTAIHFHPLILCTCTLVQTWSSLFVLPSLRAFMQMSGFVCELAWVCLFW